MAWCLIPKFADQFKQDLITGKIDPFRLNKMTSAERHKLFADKFGDINAKNLNAEFERTLLLKNQELGLINWAKKTLGEKPALLQDTISKIQRMGKLLSPSEANAFLEDLVAKRLGTHVTVEEAKIITEHSARVVETRAKINPESPAGSLDRKSVV